jgi:hypothetical protein
MPDRKPEPWESGASAPFLWIETAQGNVAVWALGSERFTVRAPDGERQITGFEEARRTAHEVAERLD